MQRRLLTWIEVGIAIASFAVAAWPFSRLCSGRPLGHDCEAWSILGVNLLAPLGVVALVCAIWGQRTQSRAPHIILGVALMAVAVIYVLINRM